MDRNAFAWSAHETVRRKLAFSLAAIVLSSTNGCTKSGDNFWGSIKIEREVMVTGVRGTPTGIVRSEDGKFFISGHSDTAWLVVTDADGRLLGRYDEPVDPKTKTKPQSQFKGIVALSGQRIVACGEAATEDGSIFALLEVFNQQGQVISRSLMKPDDNPGTHLTEFRACVAWGDGVALAGTVFNGQKTSYWTVKLRADLSKQWESTDDKLAAGSIHVLSDQSLLQASNGGEGVLTLARISQDGQVLASKREEFSEGRVVRTVPNGQIQVVAATTSAQNVLLTLNSDLSQAKANLSIGPPTVREGCAYGFEDGSVAMFGNQFATGRVYRATLGKWPRHGMSDNVHVIDIPRGDASYSFTDAVPLSARKFVAVRDEIGSRGMGFVLTWVSFD
jgi:hypothetical protein